MVSITQYDTQQHPKLHLNHTIHFHLHLNIQYGYYASKNDHPLYDGNDFLYRTL